MIYIVLAYAAGVASSALVAARLCVRADRQDEAEMLAVARALFGQDGGRQ